MRLEDFNRAEPAAAATVAQVWAAVPRWVEALVAARPYADVESAAAFAEWAAQDWSGEDLDAALAHHPRIGQRATGEGAEASASRREQASMADASADLAASIAAANAEYERRFGRVFLIRAAGRGPDEMLAEAQRRLGNAPEAEVLEALEQLKQIALLRLRQTLGADAN